MKLITRDTDYAVRALCRIAAGAKQGEGSVSARDLVRDLNMPRAFLRKILQTLGREKILRSIKGKSGGFSLNKPAEKIYLKDVIIAFQGPLEITKCIFRKKICPNSRTCLLRKKLAKVEKYIEKEIGGVTIASLI